MGYVQSMEHIAGAVYAPALRGGTLFSGAKGEGVFIEDERGRQPAKISKTEDMAKAFLIVGLDCFMQKKYPLHYKVLGELGEAARTCNTSTTALGLGCVASGAVDAMVQPLQSPWDWAAGKVLVEEAGGKFVFCELEGEGEGEERSFARLKRIVDRLEVQHYHPLERRLAFVAGNPQIVDQIMNRLRAYIGPPSNL